jgi:large subunit ribosomal protein L23
MSIYHSIIRYPSITEKNTTLRTSQNKYVFEVAPEATKPQIKKAVEKIFGVNVISVNTIVVKGKLKRTGKFAGYRSNWKKAIVKVQTGQVIAKFGEV